MAGVAEASVADSSCADHPASPEGAGDGSGTGKAAHAAGIGEAVRVIAKLAEEAGAQDAPEPGKAGDDRGLGVLVK